MKYQWAKKNNNNNNNDERVVRRRGVREFGGLGQVCRRSPVPVHVGAARQRHVRLPVAGRVHRPVWTRDVQRSQHALWCCPSASSSPRRCWPLTSPRLHHLSLELKRPLVYQRISLVTFYSSRTENQSANLCFPGYVYYYRHQLLRNKGSTDQIQKVKQQHAVEDGRLRPWCRHMAN